MNKKIILVSALVALVVTLGLGAVIAKSVVSEFDAFKASVVAEDQSNLGGGLSDRDVQAVSLKVGLTNQATKTTFIKNGTCNLSQSSAGSHAASSSKEYFCAVTGVLAGDLVTVDLPAGAGAYTSGAQSIFGGFTVNSAYATTSGRIGVSVLNNTGAATSSAPQATTSAQYTISRGTGL